MALLISGKSKCTICNKVMNEGDLITMFPPFTGNSKDKLFMFSDSGFHESCFNQHKLKDQVLSMVNKSRAGIGSFDRKCMITNERIKSMDKEEVISMITSDPSENLYGYNFFRFDKDNLEDWSDREILLQFLEKFKEEGKWESIGEFNYLDYLINLMQVKKK